MQEYLEVVTALGEVFHKGRHLDDALANTKPLSRQIAYGVVRQFFLLEHLLSQLVTKPLPEKHDDLNILILAALYSVIDLNRPAHASVNAAVEATSGLGKKWAKGLVNGVLRNYLRKREAYETLTNESIEVRFNHPLWLIDAITASWPDRPEIFAANNARAPLCLRVNLLRITRDDYLALLAVNNIPASAGKLTHTAVYLDQPMKADEIPGFTQGLVSIQDESPQLAAALLNLLPAMRVLDACAAPGGKTCHILEHEPAVHLVALDIDPKRVAKIRENLDRLELNCELETGSLLDFHADDPDNQDGKFDRILLDGPCTATGIIRRHPDIKLLREKSDVDKLTSTQSELLKKAFSLLKPGGELLYSTCSVLAEENDDVVDSFLRDHSQAAVSPINLEPVGTQTVATRHGIQLLPTSDQHDGFYYSRIKRTTP